MSRALAIYALVADLYGGLEICPLGLDRVRVDGMNYMLGTAVERMPICLDLNFPLISIMIKMLTGAGSLRAA